jgi:hypothetical protein
VRSTLWLVLGCWLGSWMLFAFGVAPTAFRILPSSEIAGSLVSPLLRGLHLYGIAAGLGLSCLGMVLRRGPLLSLLPLALAGLCAFSEFSVTASISGIRPEAFGEGATPDAAARFASLHTTSRALYSAVLVGVAALTVLHSRADLRVVRPSQQ